MPHIVCDGCVGCKRTDCVDVCPVDCFKEGPNFVVIDPNECIDCGVCIPECPESAIFPEEEVPEDQLEYIELNRELSAVWPSIKHKKPYAPDADSWREIKNKIKYIKKEW